MGALQVPAAAITADKPPQEALKQIEYKYYFRGQYQSAISALQTFLARTDISREQAVSAREYLAASYVLSGRTDKGKEQFLRLLTDDERYKGPDPTRFKAEVVEAFDSTRDAYMAVKLRTAPSGDAEPGVTASGETGSSKPLYKKWWFYVGLAAVAVVAVAAASPKDEETAAPPQPTGTVTVGVRVR
jgi:tetratricopeptide (TPR) repeat protein